MRPTDKLLSDGFTVFEQAIDQLVLYEMTYNKHPYDHPVRGHDRNGNYFGTYHDGVEWANYWTSPLNTNEYVKEIREIVDPIVSTVLIDPVFYHSDLSVMTPLNSLVRPHVDTPYRHKPWNDKHYEMLSIQVAIPIHQMSVHAGTTAFLPGSHKQHWDIAKCYSGKYTEEFLADAEQPVVNYGDMLLWDGRVLHSQMPNVTDTNRYMLLMNYLEGWIIDDVMKYEASQFS